MLRLGQGVNRAKCAHPEMVVNTTAGLERSVCLVCGEVTVRNLSELDGDLDRARFSRPADQQRRH